METTAPYFDPLVKQKIHCLDGGRIPQRLPAEVRSQFEARGWVVYEQWLQKYDKFFEEQALAHDPAGDSPKESKNRVSSKADEEDGPSSFSGQAMILDLDLTGYDIGSSSGHGAVIFRIGNRWRVLQAFAGRISLGAYLGETDWMGPHEASAWWKQCKMVAFAHKSEAKEAENATLGSLGIALKTDSRFSGRTDFSDGRSLGASIIDFAVPELMRVGQEFVEAFQVQVTAQKVGEANKRLLEFDRTLRSEETAEPFRQQFLATMKGKGKGQAECEQLWQHFKVQPGGW